MIIDVLAHHVSKSVAEILETKPYYGESATFKNSGKQLPYPIPNADPEVRLAYMEKYGIDMQVLSQTGSVLIGFDAKDSAEICRRSNTDNYALVKAYPKKFINISFISLLDMNSAMDELSRSINELDCRGVTVCTNQQGRGLDSPEFYPFYEKLVEHDLPFFMHPTHWDSYPLVDMDGGWRMMQIIGWPFDTTQAVWRLLFGGVMDRFPTMKIVTHHLGAFLPFFITRVEKNINTFLAHKLKRPLSEYWKNLYADTAVDGTVAALPCGYAFFGSERMMFGTDYPFGPEAGEDFIRSNLAAVQAMNIPAVEKKKILGENAMRILKIK